MHTYIGRGRNHNDSDLIAVLQIDDTRKPWTFTHWRCDCGKTITSEWLFWWKQYKGYWEDVRRMSRGCPEGNQRGPKDLYRMVWGCIENAYIHRYGQKSQWFRPDCCFADRWYPETMSIYIVELCLRMSQQGQQEDVYKGCPLYIYFLSKQNLAQLTKYQQSWTYIIIQCIINKLLQ